MKNPTQIVLLIVLLIGGFWIGIQWGQVSREKKIQQQLDAIIAERSTNTTVTHTTNTTPAITPIDTTTNTTTNTSSVTPTPTEVVTATTVTPEPETVTPIPTTPNPSPVTANVTQTLNPNEKVVRYENKSFGYSFDIPANVYYSGFAAEGGAVHTFGIKKDAVPEILSDATTRVYYYGKKILPELQNATMYQDPQGKFIEVLVNGTHSIRIESDNLNSSTVARIIQTITVTN